MAFQDEDFFNVLTTDIANRLLGDDWFGKARMLSDGTYVTIPVLAPALGDVDKATQEALAMAGPGICLQVRILDWDPRSRNVPGPYLEQINVKLIGLEVVPRNRGTVDAPSPTGTLKSIQSTILRAQKLLQLWTPPSITRALWCGPAKLSNAIDQDGNVINGIEVYEAYVRAAGGVGFTSVIQVATPTIVNNSGVITLACDTPGASIWYSTDNSNPSPRNGTVYLAPVALAASCLFKARAYLEYYTTSQTAQIEFVI